MHILTDDDMRFWNENGYVIVRQAVPPDHVNAVVDAIWDFQQMQPDDPESWYRKPDRANGMLELNGSGMVEMYHHPAMWANRQLPRIHGAFADIWGTEKLWVTIDRVNLNIPNRPGFDFEGFIHWDIDTSVDPLPFDVQGVLSLTDTTPGCGGFQCVAGMPKRLKEWIATQPTDRNPHRPDLTGLTLTEVATNAGDLLIWNSLLPHGVSPNRSEQPRMAQYISMSPAQENNETARQWRIDAWMNRRPPEGDPFPGDPRNWEIQYGTTAALTPLGRKLLGLDRWTRETEATEAGGMFVTQERGRTRATPGFAS